MFEHCYHIDGVMTLSFDEKKPSPENLGKE